MRQIYVNLPVRDLDASKAFFEAIGFTLNPAYTDDTAACMVIDENIALMLLTHPKFREFVPGGIADATAGTEVINAISADSREEVDELKAKALAAGATSWKPPMDEAGMYSRSFQDLDGHVWESLFMDPRTGAA